MVEEEIPMRGKQEVVRRSQQACNSPLTAEHFIDTGLSYQRVITFEPLILVLPHECSVMSCFDGAVVVHDSEQTIPVDTGLSITDQHTVSNLPIVGQNSVRLGTEALLRRHKRCHVQELRKCDSGRDFLMLAGRMLETLARVWSEQQMGVDESI